MAFAFSPGGGTVGWGRDAIVAFAFSPGGGWGGGEIGKALQFPLTVSRHSSLKKHPFLRYRVSALLTHPCY